ncbi:isoleucyl-tRNA synthetase [Pedobacter lusitanus]
MKLQKAIIVMVLAIIAFAAYMIMSSNGVKWSKYILEICGLFLMLGGLLFLYPILFARKDKEGCVELDPDVPVETGKPIED